MTVVFVLALIFYGCGFGIMIPWIINYYVFDKNNGKLDIIIPTISLCTFVVAIGLFVLYGLWQNNVITI